MRILDFSDGYESSVAPTQSFAVSTSLRSFANDAAYVTAKGAAASEGDIYHNSTSDQIKYHDGSAWREVVSASGTQTIGGDKTFSDNVVVTGNFTVNGTVTTVNTATLDVEDANITINKGGNQTTANSSVSGLTVEMTDATDARVGYDSTLASKWKAGEVGSEVEVATVSHTQTLTNKTISGSSNTLSNIARSSLATGSNYRLLSTNGSGAVQDAAAITASRMLVSDANGIPTHSSVTASRASALGIPPSLQKFTSGSGTYNKNYAFIITSGSATAGATYTNNAVTFTVWETVSSATLVYMSGSGAPAASGVLTKSAGTGDSTLTFSISVAPLYLEVEGVGAGGGGAGSSALANHDGGAGGTGGNTTFGSTLFVGNGGVGGNDDAIKNAGGTASLGTGIIGVAIQGGAGQLAYYSVSGTQQPSGSGGVSPYGGAGQGAVGESGSAAATNSGSGGGGGGSPASGWNGSGGSAGGYFRGIIRSPSDTYAYAIGAAGAAGTAGTSGFAGGAGAAGQILVWEHYV